MTAAPPPTPAEGDLRVWWIPQIPGEPFYVPVQTLQQARAVLGTLARYDLFQLEHNIKPDYSNAGGLDVFTSGEWYEWESMDGDNIDSIALPDDSFGQVGFDALVEAALEVSADYPGGIGPLFLKTTRAALAKAGIHDPSV